MSLATDRKRALKSFMATPQSMDACCNLLHLNSGSQVHKDIIRAIVQVTGYGKQHVKPDSIVEPRAHLADGTRSSKFGAPFEAIVDHFLNDLKAGVLFFPVHLPDHHGWTTSFWPEDRLEWRSLVEREEIRGGIILMFENIKNNGVTIDLTGAEVYQSFTTDDCDDCGSGITPDGDDIVYCSTCRVGHHQSCYNIYPVPEEQDPWYCNPCDASKQARSSGKRRHMATPKKATSRTRNVRFDRDDSDYSGILDSPRTVSDDESTDDRLSKVAGHLGSRDVPSRKRRSSSIVHLSVRQSKTQTPTRRVANQLANYKPEIPPPAVERSHSRTPDPRAICQPENLLHAVEHSESTSSLPSISAPNFNIPEDRTPSLEPILSHQQMEGTILLTRLKDEKIFRSIRLSKIRTVDNLFTVCAERWPSKFNTGRISRLLYVDEKEQHVEIVGGSSADFGELLRMIKREWSIQDTQIVHVVLVLLGPGEIVDF